jgi:hypothetical protein
MLLLVWSKVYGVIAIIIIIVPSLTIVVQQSTSPRKYIVISLLSEHPENDRRKFLENAIAYLHTFVNRYLR